MRILLVDDDPGVRAAMIRVLAAAGHEVRAFAQPAEAAEAVAADPHGWAGALLDVNLGQEDGVALAARLRSIAPRLPIVFCTGSAESAARAKRLGRVLLKPCEPDELRAMLGEWER